MTWEEAIEYCETHKCQECLVFNMKDRRTNYEKQTLHAPCCINLVNENIRGEEKL